MLAKQLTLDEALSQLEECAARGRALLKENIQLRKQLAEKEKLLEEMGQRLQAAETAQSELKFHERMEKVSVKRCNSTEKKILVALHTLQQQGPLLPGGFIPKPSNKELAKLADMAERTVKTWLPKLEEKMLVQREGQTIKIDDRVEANPFAIHKIVPVERPENRGGKREKGPEELFCTNCGSPHVKGYRHDSYLCNDCGIYSDDRYEFPAPAPDVEETPGPIEYMSSTLDSIMEPAVKQVPVPKLPPFPDKPCAHCKRPQRVCWVWLVDEQEGTGWWDCSCLIEKVSA